MFVPPVWAGCKCVYNEIKGFLIFPGSLFAATVIISLTYIKERNGRFLWKVFLISLGCFIVLFSALGFLISPISEYIKENEIPIFQPDYEILDVDADLLRRQMNEM